jgi:hypothetical protein
MSELWTIGATAVVALIPIWFGYWLAGKPRLIVFSPNSTAFELDPPQAGSPPMTLRAGQIFLQNTGRKSASEIQILAELGAPPWGYNIVPPVDHSVRTGARGEWILDLPFLGPGETIGLQVLNGPQIASVRSKEGPAKAVPVTHQRVFPPAFRMMVGALMLIGLMAVAYGVVQAGELIFLSS